MKPKDNAYEIICKLQSGSYGVGGQFADFFEYEDKDWVNLENLFAKYNKRAQGFKRKEYEESPYMDKYKPMPFMGKLSVMLTYRKHINNRMMILEDIQTTFKDFHSCDKIYNDIISPLFELNRAKRSLKDELKRVERLETEVESIMDTLEKNNGDLTKSI